MTLARLLLSCLLACAAGLVAAQQATTLPRHHEVLLYLRGSGVPDAVAQARAAVPATLARHRLSDPAAVRAWDGQGPMPVAFEPRNMNGQPLDEAEIFDTAEPLRDVLGVPALQPATALAVMIGVPRGLDIAAYVEALRLTVDVAKALRAPAFLDGETRELRRTRALAERLTEGRRGGDAPVSPTNPPRLTIMEGITAYEQQPDGGLRTRGLRKLGLPDLALADWVPGLSPFWVFDAVGNLLTSGKLAATPGTTFSLRVDQPEVAEALHDGGRPGGSAVLHLAAGATPGLLQIDFPGPPGTHLYERQMLVAATLWPSDYAELGEAPARELTMAVARAKSRVRELRARFPALRAQGTRVFVGTRMDFVVKHLPHLRNDSGWVGWDEVVDWTPEGNLKLRQWKGDPRAGGAAARYDPPLRIGDAVFEYRDSEVGDDLIEDILLVDRSGKASGGEVTQTLTRLIAEAIKRREAGR